MAVFVRPKSGESPDFTLKPDQVVVLGRSEATKIEGRISFYENLDLILNYPRLQGLQDPRGAPPI